ncbi:MAG: BatD family protein [Verrucomicrobiota bacterium]
MALFVTAAAQAATVRAYVQPTTARPNQVVNYVITVQDGQVQSLPNLRFPLQIGQTSGVTSSQQIQIVNGRQTASLHLSWGIQASEPGEFVIPPQTIVVDGQPLTTNEVKLMVENGGADFSQNNGSADDANKPILQIELGKKEIYQGEVVPVNVSLYVPRQVQLRRLGLIEMEKSDFAIARFPQTNEQSSTIIDGVGYYVLTFRSTLSSLRTGDMKVGPANLELLVETPMENQPQRGGFPPGFGQNFPPGFFPGMSEPRKLEIKSQQVTLKVLPLPAEGKPANFSGAVGEFQMTATASPTDLTVGDPISAEIAVSGAGNFDALTTPALVSSGGWKLYPAKRYVIEGPMDQNQTPTLERKIGYTQVLVPEAVHPVLPAFELNYFSPAQKQYVVLRTEPIPLTMKPAPAAAVESAGPGGSGTVTEVQVPPPVSDPQADITDILVRPAERSNWLAPTSVLLLHSRSFWTVQVVPVGLFALACVLAVVRRRRAEQLAGSAGDLRLAWEEFEAASNRSGTSDEEFLHEAAQFIQHVNGSQRATGPVQSILDRYETTNFTSAHAPRLEPAARREIHSTLSALMRQTLAKLSVIALAFLFSAATLQAADAPKAKAASPDEVYREALAEMEKGNFARAQYLAESLTKKTPPHLSAELFQIIGHARYRQGDMGRAALWYQRSQLLDARNPELRQNLRHIFERTRYLSFGESSPLRLASLWLTTNEWLILAAGGAWLFLLALTWRVFRSSAWAVVVCVVGISIAIPAGAFAALRPLGPERVKDISVVTQADANSYTSATVTSGSVIALPPGTQVRTLEKRGPWYYVDIPSSPENLRGWVEGGAITPLWIWDADLVP